MKALRCAKLLCSPKKTLLFLTEVDFLGHHISAQGIEADAENFEKILNWKLPRLAKEVHAFLGLVQYISVFLPKLAELTSVLMPLMTKACDALFPTWTSQHKAAFLGIRQLVTSANCLTTINHKDPGDNKIWVTCDASQWRTSACLSFGKTWETARPVAFKSQQMNLQQQRYLTHEQELLLII